MKKHLLFLAGIAVLIIASCGKELEFQHKAGATNTVITTFAGNGTQGSVNGTGKGASFYNPTGLAVDTAGNVYVADYRNNVIRKITPAGVVSTFAGQPSAGSADGTGTYASFNQPTSIAIDAAGNLYVADTNNHLIRKISPAGAVTTVAGTGVAGAADGIGIAASFNYPQGLAVDASGNVYVADLSNNSIREISATGAVSTTAGNGTEGSANGLDTAARFTEPTGLAVDASGNIFVADAGNNLIRKIAPGGNVTTFAGSGTAGSANGTGTSASFNGPTGIAIDATGNLYVADYGNNQIRKITPAGAVTTVDVGSTATSTSAFLSHPYALALDAAGNIYVANYGNSTILKIGK